MKAAEEKILDFCFSENFINIVKECFALPERLRHEFVELVLLSTEQLSARGVHIPHGLRIQRSYFADRRPTLFCVTCALPDGCGWKKVTMTFDNELVALQRPYFATNAFGELLE
jgi:hypothetical protein